MPTARPIIMPVLLLLELSVATPLVTTLADPTVKEPTVAVPELRVLDRADEEAVVAEDVPEVVAPVPVTTTEPS